MSHANVLAAVGYDCPSCGGKTQCETDCICPVCYHDRTADNLTNSLSQWAAFAPLLLSLNAEKIYWDWSTSFKKPTVHSVEIKTPDNALVEIFYRNNHYIAEYCTYNRHDNSWTFVMDVQSAQAETITAWINQFR